MAATINHHDTLNMKDHQITAHHTVCRSPHNRCIKKAAFFLHVSSRGSTWILLNTLLHLNNLNVVFFFFFSPLHACEQSHCPSYTPAHPSHHLVIWLSHNHGDNATSGFLNIVSQKPLRSMCDP